MSAIRKPKKKLTEDEYLAIEAVAEVRSEFYDGEMFAMLDSNLSHSRVKTNLVFELGVRCKNGPWQSFSSTMRVKVKQTGFYAYPDVVILHGKPVLEQRHETDTLFNPIVLVEIVTKSTEGYDRGPKFNQFQRLASVKEYHIVSSDRISVDRFVRQANGKWLLTTFDKPTGKMILETVPGVRIPLADVYRDVELPESPGLR